MYNVVAIQVKGQGHLGSRYLFHCCYTKRLIGRKTKKLGDLKK